MSFLPGDIWTPFKSFGAGATITTSAEGVLRIADAGADTNGSRYVMVNAKGGDKLRFEVMARALSGQGRMFFNLVSLPGQLAGENIIAGNADFQAYALDYVVPHFYSTVDIYVGIGCTVPDIGVIEAFSPAIYLNGTDLFSAYGTNWTSDGGQVRMGGKSIIDVKLYGEEKSVAIASQAITGDIWLPFGTVDARLRMIGNYNYNSCFGILNLNPLPSEGPTIRLIKSRSSVAGQYSATQVSDPLSAMDYWGDNGTGFGRAARMEVIQDAAVVGALVPGRWQLKVTTPTAGDQTSLVVDSSRAVRPGSDNVQNLGSASQRWATVYAGTGTINTSDEREKEEIAGIPDAVLDAWSEINYQQFKFRDAIEGKGEEARMHIGVIAQRVKDAFEKYGIDPFAYGVLCFDEWEELPEIIDETEEQRDEEGNVVTAAERIVVQEYRPAGNRYGVRYVEAHAIEAALLRRTTERLAARLAALEAK